MSSPTSVFRFPKEPYIPFISRDRCSRVYARYSWYVAAQGTWSEGIAQNDLENAIASLLDCEVWQFDVRDLRDALERNVGSRVSLDSVFRCIDDWRIQWNDLSAMMYNDRDLW